MLVLENKHIEEIKKHFNRNGLYCSQCIGELKISPVLYENADSYCVKMICQSCASVTLYDIDILQQKIDNKIKSEDVTVDESTIKDFQKSPEKLLEQIKDCENIDELKNLTVELHNKLKSRNKQLNSIMIKCLTNGKTYDSIRQAAQELRLCDGSIKKVLDGSFSQTCGYTFVHVK